MNDINWDESLSPSRGAPTAQPYFLKSMEGRRGSKSTQRMLDHLRDLTYSLQLAHLVTVFSPFYRRASESLGEKQHFGLGHTAGEGQSPDWSPSPTSLHQMNGGRSCVTTGWRRSTPGS